MQVIFLIKSNYLICVFASKPTNFIRTFKGNVGLINKYTTPVILEWLQKNDIPYDEIYFNKPWGYGELRYIDDKLISINELEL